MSIARYLSKLGATLGSDGKVPAAGIADGAITSAKIVDGTIVTGDIADDAITSAKIATDAVSIAELGYSGMFMTTFNVRTGQQNLVGDSGWVDSLSLNFTVGKTCNVLFLYSSSSSFESGPVQGFARLVLDGTMVGYNVCVAKQSTANSAGGGTVFWDRQGVSAGTHTIKVQLRNTQGGSTWTTPYFSADGQTGNLLGVLYYA